jgi:hypothetical protein
MFIFEENSLIRSRTDTLRSHLRHSPEELHSGFTVAAISAEYFSLVVASVGGELRRLPRGLYEQAARMIFDLFAK